MSDGGGEQGDVGPAEAEESAPLLGRLLDRGAWRLKVAGVEKPRRDARLLAGHVLGLSPGAVLLADDRLVSPEEALALEAVIARRETREPVSRILGHRGFWRFDLALGADTLDPRPDTETLVEAGLAVLEGGGGRILDLGTGSGCVLLALLADRPGAIGLGIDIAPGAARVALRNARTLGLERRALFAVGDWAAAVAGPFDLVVSNPPYIPSADIAALEPEVARFDPPRALDGGADGLDPYRILAAQVPALLAPAGVLAVEFGQGQARDVARLLEAGGLCPYEIKKDLAGEERCLLARRQASGPLPPVRIDAKPSAPVNGPIKA
ncbi:protein-(glutamine-N5) methyltransferase, release factor-specific [Rhodospirillum rubrum]|uniref:peptide chain release factor N(5)-glutamine methyltransferase n=1 Tax=Rhodospirillum rubrum TaxID=1085 RepID=UPI001908779F|nr:peptide chain release factor N(5)-glutamine methyltransferase [Rhodospirillum rubrum]MBK1663625.1 protein-(glutamine-N5) methyltransferase, release factor-specific [Rhodospirillum rubrum]MBK1675964.1 protein-(glutamine-N5) methyltransferase, release factor-specific [Rhodospirillum rubrum]